ncbi:MAG: hypothetical protein LBU23_12685 [Planctomycetota bacterium]|jgi:hypothetical protein|nr:hypothetical protein [Planctomycetota bacterium]
MLGKENAGEGGMIASIVPDWSWTSRGGISSAPTYWKRDAATTKKSKAIDKGRN